MRYFVSQGFRITGLLIKDNRTIDDFLLFLFSLYFHLLH